MAAIGALLNPSTSPKKPRELTILPKQEPPRLLSPMSPPSTRDISEVSSPRKKQKIVKDQPVFTRGPVRGENRYRPFEYDDREITAYHQEFDMFPMEDFGAYPRHIPYNSEKKLFQGKTGRDFFEVFQYQFKVPGSDQYYTLLWDYNIGLVRTTPLFKCCGYGKTTPAKMLTRNVGLREICHSITGGSLVAQGYWIPYEAAKAVAATFCWNIRYALTPVFGSEFISMCIPPGSPKFGVMLIDEKITQLCTEQAQEYLRLELANPTTRPTSALNSPRTPVTPKFPHGPRQIRPRPISENSSSGYSTDQSDSDNYLMSPGSPVPFRHPWSAINTPRSAPRVEEELLSPRSLIASVKAKRAADEAFGPEDESEASSSVTSPKGGRFDHRMIGDEEYNGANSKMDVDSPSIRYHGGRDSPKMGTYSKDEMEAAETLMDWHHQDKKTNGLSFTPRESNKDMILEFKNGLMRKGTKGMQWGDNKGMKRRASN